MPKPALCFNYNVDGQFALRFNFACAGSAIKLVDFASKALRSIGTWDGPKINLTGNCNGFTLYNRCKCSLLPGAV